MNVNNLQQIFNHYVEQFDRINGPEHGETYKWQIAKMFRPMMDDALAVEDKKLPGKLAEIKKMTCNVIDNYTTPLGGLCKFAEKEPATVRSMFVQLFKDDKGDLDERQKRVEQFLAQSHELKDRYFPGSYLYDDDMHSVTAYMALYDPDHNYIFKSSHASIFADCVEFYGDWGSGDTVKLAVYYQMCDEIVAAIKKNADVLNANARRFAGDFCDPSTLYEDPDYHILAFDLIYCCSTYGLFDGISFSRPKAKDRQLLQSNREKAIALAEQLATAQKDYEDLADAKRFALSLFKNGQKIQHKTYGEGTIAELNENLMTVDFASVGSKKLSIFITVANGLVAFSTKQSDEMVDRYKQLLGKESGIKAKLTVAEKELEPYKGYL